MQAFHALRLVDEAAYLSLLRASLRRGGLLMLLTGNANEPDVGPSVLTEQVYPHFWQYRFIRADGVKLIHTILYMTDAPGSVIYA